MRELLKSRLAPFRHRAFRRFFFVQTLSLTGSFATDLARAYIVIQLLGKASALGMLLMAVAIPGLFLILHGGVLVDRIDVRRLMIWTKTLLAFISLGLAALAEFSHLEFWQLVVAGVLEGLVTAFDAPAFQALTVRLVPRIDFQQALALNSTNFHASRMLGPLIAGALMAWHGPSLVFVFDAFTFFGVVGILSTLNLDAAKREVTNATRSQWAALLDGLRYIIDSPKLLYKTLQLLLTISLIFPLMLVVFRAYVKNKFNLDAGQFGLVFTLTAIGSMTGALSFAVIKPRNPIRALLAGVPGAAVAVFGVQFAPNPIAAGLTMAIAGFFMYLTFASLTVSMQLEVLEEYRGRLGSVIGLCFVSIGPLMSFPVGAIADNLGFEPAIDSFAITFIVLSALLALFHARSMDKQPQIS